MINQSLVTVAKNLLEGLLALRKDSDALNLSLMAAMDQEEKVEPVRALFPELLRLTDASAELITDAFLTADWEEEGNSADVLYGILDGTGEVPDELKGLVAEFIEGLNVTEQPMIDRFGPNPVMTLIESIGLKDEFENLIIERDEVSALAFAMQETPGLPLAASKD